MVVRAVSNNPASPVYNANAPNLTGQVGSLTAVLDAVLVSGFTGFTALGWSIAFTTTNKRAYLQNTTGANNPSGMYLYVDDTGPGAGAAREARACGFETMSAITPTGTGQFPTTAQMTAPSGAVVIRKSTTADATTRFWTIVGTGQTIYCFFETGDQTNPFAVTTFSFGDFKSYKASDIYAVMIIGRLQENNGAASLDPMHAMLLCNAATPSLGNVLSGHFIARSWTGLGTSQRFAKLPPNLLALGSSAGFDWSGQFNSDSQTSFANTNTANVAMGTNRSTSLFWPPPNSPDGSFQLEPVYISHSYCRRGYLYGLWYTLMDRPFGHNDSATITSGNLSGKTMLAQMIQANIGGNDQGQCIVETSNTWS